MVNKNSLMIQGTTSDAGKSIAVTALCRVLKRRNISVAPFKPQNMALNSAVTKSGGEIGRAQALQAQACGIEPSVDMNPVLLKPSSDSQSQVILCGKAVDKLEAAKFGSIQALAFETVMESYNRLQKQFDVVLVEGAGSPAEVNLRENDIANMGFAEAADCPVLLISDIDRGGVFAHLVGTLALLSESEQRRVKGFLINKFRGSLSLLQGGLDWLEQYTGKDVLGVLPYIPQLRLDAEDAIHEPASTNGHINICIPVFSRISNHTDFEPLAVHPDVNLCYIAPGKPLPACDLIILPGSKNVREEMQHLKAYGWDEQIMKHLRYGGKLLGICGGFQLMGKAIHDPLGIEGEEGSSEVMGLIDLTTTLEQNKQLKNVEGSCHIAGQARKVQGFEIHCGRSTGAALNQPFCRLQDHNGETYADGYMSTDGQIIGTYVHGLFENALMLTGVLEWVSGKFVNEVLSWTELREAEINRLADVFEEHVKVSSVIEIASNSG